MKLLFNNLVLQTNNCNKRNFIWIIVTNNYLHMKNNAFILMVFILVVGNLTSSYAQETFPNYQVGIQTSFPIGGLSAKANITETHSAQAVVGIFGPVSSYFGRYLYNFDNNESNWGLSYRPYLYGQAGYYVYDLGSTFNVDIDKETNFGFGFGGGIEWHMKEYFNNLKFNLEVGYNKVDFEYYKFKTIAIGVGMHYQFNL